MLKSPFVITIIWALFILFICLIPGSNIPKLNSIDIPYLDKMIHFGMYLILSILLVSTIRRSSFFDKNPKLSYMLVVLLAILYGGAIELLQDIEVFARDSDYLDFIANAAGVISGLFIYFLLRKLLIRMLGKV